MGVYGSVYSLGRETSFIRRRLSVASVIVFGQRLTGRMSQVGGQNAVLTGERRQQWRREAEMSRREREASWLERVSAREVVMRGRFWRR